ncbi:UvrD-helicase domain-containing protein [Aquabacterium sp.]|uniref:UvrD-helicase domain-containing protein n=1 Tax=Aquabacterium sp. TaxID=1872578 RepID=UPI00248A6AC7|nr:UvrD-helicase domain-containing protein [Aquabacterium sp.]MDI1350851.1 3'-5' exonuclease [Aquabacterium sp.]
MDFRIADTFTDSLAKLTGDEQKAVKTTAFDLQLNPAHPSMSLHKIEQSKDKNFWSVRVSSDIRLIVHKTATSFLLCYVDHHDKAYKWAERRKLEVHPKTGAAQWVEIRERVEDVVVRADTDSKSRNDIKAKPPAPIGEPNFNEKPLLFIGRTDDELLSYGVPSEWLADVRKVDEDSLLILADHLPAEAVEALLELATGGAPKPAAAPAPGNDPFNHPDAQRRFRVMKDVEELERALDFPWEKWTVFLHPAQRQWVDRDYTGPARISGSAGTGKTIVALHRAVHLARQYQDSRVLLATFSETLASALGTKLQNLISNQPRLAERLEIHSMEAIGKRLYTAYWGRPKLATQKNIAQFLNDAAKADSTLKFSTRFMQGEWNDLVDAWQLKTWEAYRDVKRLGRKTRLSEAQRVALWAVFEQVQAALRQAGLITHAEMFTKLAEKVGTLRHPPFEHVVVDEAQDVSIAQLRLLAAIGSSQGAVRPNSLFFAGDLGQRIFQQPFSWKSLGVDVRVRSRTLHINYRTSHQIRAQADKLLGPVISDVDGNQEDRLGTVSVFNGPSPEIRSFKSEAAEGKAVTAWLLDRTKDGLAPHELGVFVRSEAQVARAVAAVTNAGVPYSVLDEHVETSNGLASVCTMHLAKGLEFRAVVVMACDDEVIPLQERVEAVTDDADIEEVYNSERNLLYVACTRARDRLLVTSAEPSSEFLEDLRV